MKTADGSSLFTVEHATVSRIAGPLLVAEHANGVGYNELVEIVGPDGQIRRGQVLAVEGSRIIVQVLAGTAGLNLPDTIVRTRGEVARTAVGIDLVGRILDGAGDRSMLGLRSSPRPTVTSTGSRSTLSLAITPPSS